MTLERAIEILEQYNKWRKGEIEGSLPFVPRIITEAIDTVVKHFKQK